MAHGRPSTSPSCGVTYRPDDFVVVGMDIEGADKHFGGPTGEKVADLIDELFLEIHTETDRAASRRTTPSGQGLGVRMMQPSGRGPQLLEQPVTFMIQAAHKPEGRSRHRTSTRRRTPGRTARHRRRPRRGGLAAGADN